MAKSAPRGLTSRWDDLHWFLVVLRMKSFTAAARALQTEQSTVSRRIAKLESALGFTLFERGRRELTPTEAARRLSESAERIEAEVSRFSDHVLGIRTQAVSGRVRLALTEELAISFVIPKLLPKLRAAYPELHLDLVTSYRAADLIGHEADIALRFFQTARGDLVGRRVTTLSTGILCSRGHAQRMRRRPLQELDWITVELEGAQAPETAWLKSVVSREPSMVCSSYQVQLAAIRAGVGVGVGPRLLTRLDPEFIVLPQPGARPPSLDLYVVTRRAIRELPRVAVVMTALTEEILSYSEERGAARPANPRSQKHSAL